MTTNTNIDDEWSSFLISKQDDDTSEDENNNLHDEFNENFDTNFQSYPMLQ